MWQTFTILATLVLAFSAWLAYENQNNYKTEIKELETVHNRFDETSNYLNKEITLYNEALKTQIAYVGKTTNELKPELGKLYAQNNKLTAQIAQKKSETEETNKQVATIRGKIAALGDLDEQIAKLKRLKSEKLRLEGEIDDNNKNIASLEQRSKENIQTIADYTKLEADQRNRISPPELATSIHSVYAPWGFVVLSNGVDKGIVPGSKLKVTRGEQQIALLLVSSVESGRASADIVPNSMQEGQILRPGDKVTSVR